MSNSEIFSEQLKEIKNDKLRDLVEKQLNNIPEYFYHIAASSTAKYHNLQEAGEGGLVRHVKAVFKIAKDLLDLEMFKPISEYRDELLTAALLHDSLKMGLSEQKYTVFEHPKLAAESFEQMAIKENYYDLNSVKRICAMIMSHSGQWNTSKYSKTILPKPSNKLENFLHLCDYLGSRRYITVTDLDSFK